MKNEKDGHYEISSYGKGETTPEVLASEIKKLRVAFPSREPAFFNLLTERIIANGFTDERLRDAVGKALDTFSYKEINISDIIRFDRHVRLYTYPELCDMVAGGHSCGNFEMREIDGRKYWIEKKPQ